jgi:uncharacterized protein YqeY
MTLKEKLQQDLTAALKQGDAARRSTLAMVQAAVKNKEIETGKKAEGLSEEEIIGVLQSEGKRRRDAALEYEKAGRQELADKERAEFRIIEEYLPAQLSDEEIQRELAAVMQELGVSHKEEFGKIMGAATKRLKGRAEGGRIKAVLDRLLS